jgi:hypothetical protein
MVETYICLGVFAKVAAALMVRYTWHLHTPITGLFVHLLLVPVQPFVHYNCPAIGVGGAPAWNRLQAIKYTTYQKIKLSILNLKINQ